MEMKNEEVIPMVLDSNTTFSLSEYSSESGNTFNGVDMSKMPIHVLITRDEWQMRLYGYKRIIDEINNLDNIEDFELVLIEQVIKDKNISSQNIGLQAISRFIESYAQKFLNLEKIWKDYISDILIKKTLYNSKTSTSSINLVFSFFEQSIIKEKGDVSKIDYIWDEMINFIGNNQKAKGIVVKQIFGIVKLFSNFIDNYGINYIPIMLWCKTIAPLLSECNDKLVKDCIYKILSSVSTKTNLFNLLNDFLTPIQIKEIQKRSVELSEKKDYLLKLEFINKLDEIGILRNQPNDSDKKPNLQITDSFDSIEAVDVIKMLPSNWLETISNKEIKWNERKNIIDQFFNLCETHKKLAISQPENKNAISLNNKRTFLPTITDYQNIFNVLQRIIKFESNTTLILSVIRLCSSITRCLRSRLVGIIRPITTQIATKLKDQNKIVCNESINFINGVLKYVLTLDQIFEDLCSYGFKEKVASAKCSAISICINLIDYLINNEKILEKHSKGIKLLTNVLPSLFDDTSINVRSSTFIILAKLKSPCFGEEINYNVQRIITGLNTAKLKLFQETEKKIINSNQKLSFNSEFQNKNQNFESRFPISASEKNLSFLAPVDSDNKPLIEKKSLLNKGVSKQSPKFIDYQKKNEDDDELIKKKSNSNNSSNILAISSQLSTESVLSNPKMTENNFNSVNIVETPKSENLPRILHSLSINHENKTDFCGKLSSQYSNKTDYSKIADKSIEKIYTDPVNMNNYIIKFPNKEIIFEKQKIDNQFLLSYIKPFVSEDLLNLMFSHNPVGINYSICFWEKYIYSLSEIQCKKFNFIYFLLLWVWNNIEMNLVIEYDRIITALIYVVIKRETIFIEKFASNLTYYFCSVIMSIINKEIFCFDKRNPLYEYELEKYQKLVILLTEKKIIRCDTSNFLIENDLANEEAINNNLLINTILISLLDKREYPEKIVFLVSNQLKSQNDPSGLLKNFGIFNIYSILLFDKWKLNENFKDSLNDILSYISSILGVQLWGNIIVWFNNFFNENYEIPVINRNEKDLTLSNLIIISSLEYEAIKMFNIIGSTGNPKEMGSFIDTAITSALLNKLTIILRIIIGNLDSTFEKNFKIELFSENMMDIYLPLIRHFNYSAQLLIHLFFLVRSIEIKTYFETSSFSEKVNFGSILFKFVEHLDKATNLCQRIIINSDFPIKTLVINTLFIMSNYFNWKEYIEDETQKTGLVNSLNNIMGINIISSFQNNLPSFVKIILEVIIFGMTSAKKTIFDVDLLNRLLPKILRRIKVSNLNKRTIDLHLSVTNYCFRRLIDLNNRGYYEQLTPLIEFILDYLIILKHNDLDIFTCEDFNIDLFDEFANLSLNFREKLNEIKSLLLSTLPTNKSLE